MTTVRSLLMVAAVLLVLCFPVVALSQQNRPAPQISSLELSRWIDSRLDARGGDEKLAQIVDDATFMRRVYLDLLGTIPSVPQVRDFLNQAGTFKREDLVDLLLHSSQRPERYADRAAEHLARVWRRGMIPKSSPNAAIAENFDPWLRE